MGAASEVEATRDGGESVFARAAQVGFPCLLAAGLVWLLLVIHRRVYEGMLNEDPMQVATLDLNRDPSPDWANPSSDDPPPTPFPFPGKVCPIKNPDFARRLAAFYEASPWVDHVDRVEVNLPSEVRVRLVVRVPIAAIQWGQTHYLVDKRGVRLPGQYPNLARVPGNVLRISGVQTKLPAPGKTWDDPGIPAGIAVASALRDAQVDDALAVDTIDVGNIDGRIDPNRSEIVLRSGAASIEWGRSPWTRKYGEPTIAQKLENLRLALSAAPGLKGVRTLKLQFDRPYMAYR